MFEPTEGGASEAFHEKYLQPDLAKYGKDKFSLGALTSTKKPSPTSVYSTYTGKYIWDQGNEVRSDMHNYRKFWNRYLVNNVLPSGHTYDDALEYVRVQAFRAKERKDKIRRSKLAAKKKGQEGEEEEQEEEEDGVDAVAGSEEPTQTAPADVAEAEESAVEDGYESDDVDADILGAVVDATNQAKAKKVADELRRQSQEAHIDPTFMPSSWFAFVMFGPYGSAVYKFPEVAIVEDEAVSQDSLATSRSKQKGHSGSQSSAAPAGDHLAVAVENARIANAARQDELVRANKKQEQLKMISGYIEQCMAVIEIQKTLLQFAATDEQKQACVKKILETSEEIDRIRKAQLAELDSSQANSAVSSAVSSSSTPASSTPISSTPRSSTPIGVNGDELGMDDEIPDPPQFDTEDLGMASAHAEAPSSKRQKKTPEERIAATQLMLAKQQERAAKAKAKQDAKASKTRIGK